MYSHEIKQLLEIKKYLITVKEFEKIISTSPQIIYQKYDPYNDTFFISTEDRYNFSFKIKAK